ncbi:efflux RND transporter permease subunit [Nafulsella turpanensis]|uniref:efflux RND transporter permease subunit n=1 Tax=Nafulsella turpanensis TaxID=1265690 RepID=UPI00037B70E4|nr:efflux RND transporter permease subunit [Nafulsella turpanensis]
MWNLLASFILKFRLPLILAIGLVTAFFATKIPQLELSYEYANVVPSDDPDMVFLKEFKDRFGEDGNVLVIGMKDSSVYQAQNLRRYKYMSEEMSRIKGVEGVLSLPLLQRAVNDQENRKFVLEPIFDDVPEDQQAVDSLLQLALDQKIYSSQLINPSNGATLMLLTIDTSILNSGKRSSMMDDILLAGRQFEEKTGIQLHYAGIPFVRSVMTTKVQAELKMFLVLSVVVTALILLFFFRSFNAVIFPVIVIGVMIVWSLGSLVLLGYKITLLTGLIPPIIVVIGIPNCIYLLNKYHQEYAKHGQQIPALAHIIHRIGFVTLITNFTTAVGFLVLMFADITILKEFGIVAGINILATFVVSIILIPAIFSYLKAPSPRHLRHLDSRPLEKVITGFDLVVHRHKYSVFAVTAVILLISIVGMFKIRSNAYMVDDIPEDSQVKRDLAFFEQNFGGVMPLEVVVDTGRPRGVMNLQTLEKIEKLETFFAAQEHITPPVSLVSFLKATRQAFYNGQPQFYELPGNRERAFILPYLRNSQESEKLSQSFVDSTGQLMRISMKVADIGSIKMDSLITQVIQPEIKAAFGEDEQVSVKITGTTLLFIKGNQFLIQNLRSSLLIAFGVISIVMALLFRNVRMIIISIIPNLVPLCVTAGLMGYFGIPLKPSTALIFSIAFGISVDDSIHFLAKYRQELFYNKFFVAKAVSASLRETGASMIYTSIVLFCGFIIFAFSDFGGTVALGILTSTTLLFAMFTNLILLPSLLLAFDSGKYPKDEYALIEHYEEFYTESEDEEIDRSQLEVEQTAG